MSGPGRTQHLLLSDGLRTIRIDLLPGWVRDEPMELRYLLSGVESAAAPLQTLRRLLALSRRGRFSPELHPRAARARRWILMLRTYDALEAGASQREIAEVLLNAEVGEPRWRSRTPSLRLQAQRLVAGARRMANRGYLDLLR